MDENRPEETTVPEAPGPSADAAPDADPVEPSGVQQSPPPAASPVFTALGEPPVTECRPVAAAERIDSVDTLRGFAVLGILVMNIYFFSLPGAVYFNPLVWGGADGLNLYTWMVTHVFFEQKFFSIFSMLFGAGVILMHQRAEQRGAGFGSVWYNRIFWLLIIGAVHAYFFWYGDILFTYAVCGLLIYLFRRLSPKVLITVGILVMLVALPISSGLGLLVGYMRDTAIEAERLVAEGQELDAMQQAMLDSWAEMKKEYYPTPGQLREEIDLYGGGPYWAIFVDRFPVVLNMQLVAGLVNVYWHIGGLMLIGMGLMKSGVFSGAKPYRFYRWMVIGGYGAGLPLGLLSVRQLALHDFDFIYNFTIGGYFNYFAGFFMALGHVGLVMLVCKSGLFLAFQRRLAAVGRMALTNYLMHTLICTLIFYSYGLGLFGRLERIQLMGVVLAIWVLQLAICQPWLKWFRFGPAEWLWRSLTYRRRQPFRVAASPGAEGGSG